jgi:predicted PurR-regulated permease PerM
MSKHSHSTFSSKLFLASTVILLALVFVWQLANQIRSTSQNSARTDTSQLNKTVERLDAQVGDLHKSLDTSELDQTIETLE